TRPEGLGGSRDAGPAAAGPRPPYVTEAERHNNVGGGYGYAAKVALFFKQGEEYKYNTEHFLNYLNSVFADPYY
ncbi:hypothetical protein L249_5991, partial [Ophiocordyceps polyrhachis-furcata BCC 54312]